MNVLVVDDHPLIHEVLQAVVRKALPEGRVQAANDLESAIELADRCGQFDLALLDLGLPGCRDIEALQRFRGALPELPVVVISAIEDRACILAALEAGASGYIPKTSTPSVMIAALRLVAAGSVYIPPQALEIAPHVAPVLRAALKQPDPAELGLTGRQLDVLLLLLQGLANRRIADRLDISENSVKQHARAVFKALGAHTRSEALLAATRRGIRLG